MEFAFAALADRIPRRNCQSGSNRPCSFVRYVLLCFEVFGNLLVQDHNRRLFDSIALEPSQIFRHLYMAMLRFFLNLHIERCSDESHRKTVENDPLDIARQDANRNVPPRHCGRCRMESKGYILGSSSMRVP